MAAAVEAVASLLLPVEASIVLFEAAELSKCPLAAELRNEAGMRILLLALSLVAVRIGGCCW